MFQKFTIRKGQFWFKAIDGGKHKLIKIILNTGISSVKLLVCGNQIVPESFPLAGDSQYSQSSRIISKTWVNNCVNNN